MPSTVRGSGPSATVVAPGAETTGNAQILSALGAPFVLEGLFGEADAEAMDAEDAAGMEDGRMQIDEEEEEEMPSRKRARSPLAELEGADGDGDGDGDDVAFRAPKRLRRLAVRSASLPTAAIAVRSRRAERLARRRREQKRAIVAAGMDVDGSGR